MLQFRDRPFNQRVGAMGDEAEAHFESYCHEHEISCVRYGLNRPPLNVAQLPARVRYTPDYLTSDAFVECQGLGKEQVFRLKIDKHGALHWWNDLWPVELYIWDSHNKRESVVSLSFFDSLIPQAEIGVFDEVKPYFAVPADLLLLV